MPRSTPSTRPSIRPSTARRLLLAACALPPLWTGVLVAVWGVDLLHWDQVELVPLLEAMVAGDLRPGDLWRPHNEHRIVLPRALMLGLAAASGWSVRLELFTNLLLAAGIFALAVVLLRDQARRQRVELPSWTWPLLSLLIFSPAQWENWSWGWQSQIFLAVLAVLGAVVLLSRDDDRASASAAASLGATAGAALCATVATWSFAVGLLSWVALAPLTLRAATRRRALVRLGLWTAAGVLVVGVTLHGLGASARPALEEATPRLLKLLGGYATIYLTTPLLGPPIVALYGGFLLLLAVAVLLWSRRPTLPGLRGVDRAQLARTLPWLVLLALGAAAAVVTGLGRVHFGLHQAASSRYTTVASLAWLGVLGLWLVARRQPPSARQQTRDAVLAAVVALLLVLQGARGTLAMRAQHADREALRERLVQDGPGALDTDDLLRIYPDPVKVRDRLETLERLELGPWRESATRD